MTGILLVASFLFIVVGMVVFHYSIEIKDSILQVIGITLISFSCAGFLLVGTKLGGNEYAPICAALKQQLEQARQEAGKPIDIGKLPDGSWCRVSTDESAILQRDGDNIIRAVVSDRKIPGQFAIKDMRMQVFDFLKENPPAEKPETGTIRHTFTPK